MRPLLLANFSRVVGGGELGLLELAQGLRQAGHEPIVALPGPGPLAAELGATAVTLPATLPGFAFALRPLFARADLVHATGARSLMAAALAAKLAPARRPLTWHVRVAARDRLDPLLQRLPDLIITNSRATAARFPAHAPVRVVYNGLPDHVPAAKALFAADGHRRIAVIGRMTPEKGHLDLLPALRAVLAEREDLEIIFVGDDRGMIGDRILRAAAESNGRMRCLGVVPDIRRHLAGFALIIVPSRIEGFGRVAAEAIRAGVTVAATRVGGLVEVLEGLDELFLPDDRAAWPAKIISLLDRPPYSAYRLQTAGERFNLAAHVENILRAWNEVMGH